MATDSVVKIFVSSPGDVRPERLVAQRIIERLDREFSTHFRVEPVLWERQPLRATDHFQTLIAPPHSTDITVVILWARLGTPLPREKFLGPLSNDAVTGTQWEFEDAYQGFRNAGTPELLVYRKMAEVAVALADETVVAESVRQNGLVGEFIARWFGGKAGEPFTGAFREFATATEFEDLLETHLRAALRQRIRAGVSVGTEVRWHKGSPYRGLSSFEPEHAAVFFGRTRARHELRELLARQADRHSAFVLVFGASGSGKSSLVRAGLVPDVATPGMIPGVGLCRYCILKPSELAAGGMAALAERLVMPSALPELATSQQDAGSLADRLTSADDVVAMVRNALDQAAAAARLTDRAGARLLVVIDQLEELFVLDAVPVELRQRFVSLLAALARSGIVWIVATMRSDFFERLVEYPELARLTEGEARYLLVPPEEFELEQMIRRPAFEAGTRFEVDVASGDSLDDDIRSSASRHPGSLPLLGFVLDQLWMAHTEDGLLTYSAYRSLGGMEGALGKRAEEEFAKLAPDVQGALPETLRLLATVAGGDDGATVARPVSLDMFPENAARRRLIDAFAAPSARLLVFEGDRGQRKVRVAHEALLSHWPRAADELRQARNDLQLRARLEADATQWSEGGQRPDLLLPPGLRLSEAEDLLERRQNELDDVTTRFIRASHDDFVAKQRTRERRRILQAVGAIAGVAILGGGTWYASSLRSGARATERTRQLESAKAEVAEGDIQAAVDRLGRVLLTDADAEPVFAQAYGHWAPAVDRVADVLRNQPPYEPFTWRGHTYVVDVNGGIHEVPAPVTLVGVSRDQRHLVTAHPGNRVIAWRLPDVQPEVAVAFDAEADFKVEAVFDIKGRLAVVGRIAALRTAGEAPFFVVLDHERHRAVPIALTYEAQSDDECTKLRLQDRDELFHLQPIEFDQRGELAAASADLEPGNGRWRPLTTEWQFAEGMCASALVSPRLRGDGTGQELRELPFPRIKSEASFWSPLEKQKPSPAPRAAPRAKESDFPTLDAGKVHWIGLPSAPANVGRPAWPNPLASDTSNGETTSEEEKGEETGLDGVEFEEELRVGGTTVAVGMIFHNHGIADRVLCRVSAARKADRCVIVTLMNGGGDVLPLNGTSLALISGIQTFSERSLWVVDVGAMDDRSPNETPDGEGPRATHIAADRSANLLAVVATDGVVWVYRRAGASEPFKLASRVAVPGVTGRIAVPDSSDDGSDRPAGDDGKSSRKADPIAAKGRPKMTGPPVIDAITFAGDRLLVARSDGQLWAVDPDTGSVLWQTPRLGLREPPETMAISPDETQVAVVGGLDVRLIATANGMPLNQLYAVPVPTARTGVRMPVIADFDSSGALVVRVGGTAYQRATPEAGLVEALRAESKSLKAPAPPALQGHRLSGSADVPELQYIRASLSEEPDARASAFDEMVAEIMSPEFRPKKDEGQFWSAFDLNGDERAEIIAFGTRERSASEREEYVAVARILDDGRLQKVAESRLPSGRESGIGITFTPPADFDRDGTKEVIAWLGGDRGVRRQYDGVFAVDMARHQMTLMRREDSSGQTGDALFDRWDTVGCSASAGECPEGGWEIRLDTYVADVDRDGTPDLVHTTRRERAKQATCRLDVYKKRGDTLAYDATASRTVPTDHTTTCEWALKQLTSRR